MHGDMAPGTAAARQARRAGANQQPAMQRCHASEPVRPADVRHRRHLSPPPTRRRRTRRRCRACSRRLAHRGPDGAGHTVVGRVALVHTRLAIIDLAGGDQPLFAGSAALVGNGEIYNYRELRAAMPGVRFATASDNELPLHLWLRDGAGLRRRAARHVCAGHPRARRAHA